MKSLQWKKNELGGKKQKSTTKHEIHGSSQIAAANNHHHHSLFLTTASLVQSDTSNESLNTRVFFALQMAAST